MTAKKKKKKLKKKAVTVICIFSTVIIIAAALFAVIKFVPQINILTVDEIVINGEVPYSDRVIIETSGIETGKSILKQSIGAARKNVKNSLPYVRDIKISYSLNGTLSVDITPDTAIYQILSSGKYYLLDDEFKVLDALRSRRDTATLMYGVKYEKEITVGEKLDTDDMSGYDDFAKIYTPASNLGITFDVIDITDSVSFNALYDGRLYVQLGTANNAEEKLKHFKAMLTEMEADKEGTVLLQNWSSDNRKASLITENIDYLTENY